MTKQTHRRLWNLGIGIPAVSAVALVGGLMVACSATEQGRSADPSVDAIEDFNARVKDYIAFQKKIVADVGPLDETKSPEEISKREKALGEAIRAARASAKQGDIFTPAVGKVFIDTSREEFGERSKLAIQDRDEAQDELPNFTPTVNQIYPTTYPLATFPPGILKRIPPLPEPLEYRFVQRNLIIRDSEANLIVDVLPNAAPPTSQASTPPSPPAK